MTDLAGIRAALAQPVPSVRVPFQADGEIDWDGLHAYLGGCLDAQAHALVLTFGDSQYSVLTDDEVADVTRAVVEYTAGRAHVVAADRSWWTGKTVEFARFCKEAGAAALMVLPPDWAQSCTPETLAAHYGAVAKEIPVLLVTTYLAARDAKNALAIIDHVYREVPGVVGVKDDVGGQFGRSMAANVTPVWTVIAGGSKRLHADLAPFGCQGYLSTLLVYRPETAWRYWRAVRSGDAAGAAAIVRDVDVPMFDLLKRSPGGFDAALHGWSELIGMHGRWRRPPYYSLSDSELDELAADLTRLDLMTH